MERSTHCNTALVRSSLRDHGVVIAGRDPRTLVDPVSADDLRAEALRISARYLEWLGEDWGVLDNAWTQPYVVVTYCRILITFATGSVHSKRAALVWALEQFEPRWHGLIRRALKDRADPSARIERRADPAMIEPTRAFVAYAVARL
jgi:hypothetical protein